MGSPWNDFHPLMAGCVRLALECIHTDPSHMTLRKLRVSLQFLQSGVTCSIHVSPPSWLCGQSVAPACGAPPSPLGQDLGVGRAGLPAPSWSALPSRAGQSPLQSPTLARRSSLTSVPGLSFGASPPPVPGFPQAEDGLLDFAPGRHAAPEARGAAPSCSPLELCAALPGLGGSWGRGWRFRTPLGYCQVPSPASVRVPRTC